jgi:hypothetical protein
MKGDRGARGIVRKNKKQINGENYTGNGDGVVVPWGGGAGAAPTVGVGPTITLPRDDDDDGDATAIASARSKRPSLRQALDGTKARLRTQLKTLANHAAFLMELAAGSRTFKAIVVDGIGGVGGVVAENGKVTAEGTVIGGIDQPRILAAGRFTGGGAGALDAGVGFDGVTPIARSGAGVYTITLANAASDILKIIATVTMRVGDRFTTTATPTGTTTIVVDLRDSSGTLADADFFLTVSEVP